ncbi:hypothetical protein B296_00000742 [Ensete ventricosum]|uniref:Alpha-1,3-glucosyltransferase n=1 Tax=Ensete ventricosum TaxID=4639 RepID=A0A427B3R7_ENSVE|nr:hypothetical protein B296_00000742 [Ensete ventricosum]
MAKTRTRGPPATALAAAAEEEQQPGAAPFPWSTMRLTPPTAAAVALFALLVRVLVSLGSYSGQGTPPMYGDYEAQRHWMEITLHTPAAEWYRNTTANDLAYWGLDYPPLTAYQSLAHALLINASLPQSLALSSSRAIAAVLSQNDFAASALFSLAINHKQKGDRERMSIYGRDPWGGPLEIHADSATDDDRSRNLDLDRAALSMTSRQLDETQQSWLLAGPGDKGKKKKKYVDLGCLIVSRKIFLWTVGAVVAAAALAGLITLIVKTVPHHHRPRPPPDNYTLALHKALMFFNAQRCESQSLSFPQCV